MARPSNDLWTDVEALHRLARAERKVSDGPHQVRSSGGLAADAFPPFHGRPELDVHSVEAPMTLAGGDYCDAFFISPHTLALVIVDVSGKGVAAAMVRGVARSVVRSISTVCPSPGDLLGRLDRILNEAELGSMFLTAFVGWYDTRSGTLRYANAGHPPPFRVTRRGDVEPLGEVTGPILGILGSLGNMDDAGNRCYGDREERLEVGDRLVLYTDGVTEAADADGEPFGMLRLTNLLAHHHATPLNALCDQVVDRVRHFEEQHRQDDVTLLALERR